MFHIKENIKLKILNAIGIDERTESQSYKVTKFTSISFVVLLIVKSKIRKWKIAQSLFAKNTKPIN